MQRVWVPDLALTRACRALLHSYCCVDYARLLDVTQLRLFRLRRALKDALQDRWAPLHPCALGNIGVTALLSLSLPGLCSHA